MDLTGFDASTVEPQRTFEPIPAGKYTAVISASEERQTRAGTGSYLSLTLQIVDGEHKGRRLFENLNIKNPNQAAVEIANKTLSSICRAVGTMRPSDSSELHDVPISIVVGTRQRQDNGETVNVVKSYEPQTTTATAAAGETTWNPSKGAPFA